MDWRITLRVALRTPNSVRRKQLEDALSVDPLIDIVDETENGHVILILDAELFQANGHSLHSMMAEHRTVIVFAPNDPRQLSGFMAGGARGYHCVDESWKQLPEILRFIADGGVRTDPVVMDHLLDRYRQLLRDAVNN